MFIEQQLTGRVVEVNSHLLYSLPILLALPNSASQSLRYLAAISWRGITDPSYWAGQGLLVWIHQRHSLRDVGSRLIDTHQTSAAELPSNNLLPRSAASNWWPHFPPQNPTTALPFFLTVFSPLLFTLSLPSSLLLHTEKHMDFQTSLWLSNCAHAYTFIFYPLHSCNRGSFFC